MRTTCNLFGFSYESATCPRQPGQEIGNLFVLVVQLHALTITCPDDIEGKKQKRAIFDRFDSGRHFMTTRWDFTYNEWDSLVRLYDHESATLPNEIDRKCRELGLTDETGLTDAGKRLVEHELLMERRNRLQR
jgi:hypothetical protein